MILLFLFSPKFYVQERVYILSDYKNDENVYAY